MRKAAGKRFRLLCCLCSVLILVCQALYGCGEKDVPVRDEKLIRVGFSQVGSESDWRP